MTLQELIEFRDRMYRDPELLAIYEQGEAKYIAAGEPSPPNPIISTREASSFSCPSRSMAGSMIWRL